ncbi:hypothetical protein BDD12DRAFT_893956 [Trichophaea hybrida]|nr:hypothetical protein BDD12DRAFT_893956 [Trichophaea hybrida]
MATVFGRETETELFSPRNGFIMSSFIEELFDLHQVAFVSADEKAAREDGMIMRWRLVVIDENILNDDVYEKGCFIRDINNTELAFKSAARPASRFLYYHYVVSILRARKFKRKGENMLRALAADAGYDIDEAMETFDQNIVPQGDIQDLDDV